MLSTTKDRSVTESPSITKSSTLVMDSSKKYYLPESKARSVIISHEHNTKGDCNLDIDSLRYVEGIGFTFGRDQKTSKFAVPSCVPIKRVEHRVTLTHPITPKGGRNQAREKESGKEWS